MLSSVPISPPVTPKDFLNEEDAIVQDQSKDFLLLPPIDHDLHRKSNVKKFCRAMAESNKQVAIPFKPNDKKAIPQKSLSPSTQGAFTMDLFQDVLLLLADGVKDGNNPSPHFHSSELSRKRRNETHLDMTESPPVTPGQPSFSTSSILNTECHVKKSKTDAAAAYDRVDITIPDQQVFQDDPKWVPNMNAFNRKQVKVNWKGSPLSIAHLPFFDLLHPGEIHIASTLRLTPEQYLKCRRSLILAAQDFDKMNLTFRKSDAQKCVRIDVNKTSALWNVFNQLGWFHPSS